MQPFRQRPYTGHGKIPHESAFLQKQNIEDLKEGAGLLKKDVRGLLGRVAAARSVRKLPGRCEWV
jgi:hypothetical protein